MFYKEWWRRYVIMVQKRPEKQKIDRQGYRLLTTGEAAELLGLSVQTIRTWCDQSRISYTRGASSGSRPGNRYISMAEIERIRSDNAYSTVSDAISRIEAINVERENDLRDLISEKAGESKYNLEIVFENLGKKLDLLQKTIDRMQPPSIRR